MSLATVKATKGQTHPASTEHKVPPQKKAALGLASRINCKWQEIVMLAGVAIAIIGLVSALLTSSYFQAVAFGVLALATLYAFVHIRNNADLSNIDDDTKALQKENTKLLQSQKKLLASEKSLRTAYTKLTDKYTALDKTFTDLKKSNDDYKKVNTDLQKNIKTFHDTNETLRKSNEQISAKVQELERNLKAAKDELRLFLDHQKELGKSLGSFEQDISHLDATGKDIDSKVARLDHTFDEDVQQLSEEIQRAKLVSERAFSSMRDQLEGLKARNDALTATEANMQRNLERMTQENNRLDALAKQREQFAEELKKSLAETRANIETERAQDRERDKDYDQLTAKVQELRQEEARFIEEQRKYNHALNLIKEQIVLSEQLQNALLGKVDAKLLESQKLTAQLEALRKEVASLEQRKAAAAAAAT